MFPTAGVAPSKLCSMDSSAIIICEADKPYKIDNSILSMAGHKAKQDKTFLELAIFIQGQ
jgi:hypothetical protein